MRWKINADPSSVNIQLNTKFIQSSFNSFEENNIHMEAKTSMTAHFIYVMPIQSLYVCITIHNTVQCTVMGEKGINYNKTKNS